MSFVKRTDDLIEWSNSDRLTELRIISDPIEKDYSVYCLTLPHKDSERGGDF